MKTNLPLLRAFVCGACILTSVGAQAGSLQFSLTPIGRFTNGAPYGLSTAEIVAHDASSQRLLVVNGRDRRIDVLSVVDPANPVKVGAVDMSPYGAVVNSVAVHHGLAAVA